MIFSVVRKGNASRENYVNPGDDITFDDTVTNIGNGMDPESGVFTAPISGIYSFSLSAIQQFTSSTSWNNQVGIIQVLRDGELEFYIEELNQYDITNYDWEGLNHSWMMSLVENEKVHLRMDGRSNSQIVVQSDGSMANCWMCPNKNNTKKAFLSKTAIRTLTRLCTVVMLLGAL